MNKYRFLDLWPIEVMVMTWMKGQRKAANKKQRAEENGGVYVPKTRRDPAITARAIANRKKAVTAPDKSDDPDSEASGSEEQPGLEIGPVVPVSNTPPDNDAGGKWAGLNRSTGAHRWLFPRGAKALAGKTTESRQHGTSDRGCC